MQLDIKVGSISNSQINAELKHTGVELEIDTNESNINLTIDYDKFIEIADKMREANGEKAYTELEDAYLIMECQIEEKEKYIEVLREVNEDLRRK